jgi:Sulfotransferase domain
MTIPLCPDKYHGQAFITMTVSVDRSIQFESIGRFALSVVASYLTECEGTCLFLSKKQWTKQFLPIFRLPPHEHLLKNADHPYRKPRHRHTFMVIPVQDTSIRLQRLNTRRWRKQGLKCAGLSTEEVAARDLCGYPPLLRFHSRNDNLFRPGITLLVSYPRSGNTLLRSLLEATTKFVTGSDTRPDRTLSLALADRHDLVGEGITSPSQTPLVKTHWPERIGLRKYAAHRAILLVRNPFDAIDSYWNLNVTNTHTEKVVDEVYEQHADFYHQLVLNEMKVWIQFLDYWKSQGIDTLWMRYEDLIQNPKEEMLRVLQFCTCRETELWVERVESVLQWRGHGYQSAPLGRMQGTEMMSPFGRSLQRYPPDLQQRLHDIDTRGWLETFGYHVFKQNFPENVLQECMPPVPAMNVIDTLTCATTLQVNFPSQEELRSPSSPFGRKMRDWRRKYTADDTNPFPTRRRR